MVEQHDCGESLLYPGDLFFSMTDHRGVITMGNSVFCRISGYTMDELLGQPHNIIRHDDMPRAVFYLLWDRLHRGEIVAAYVKNRAKNGDFYWVMALVGQCPAGYLSIRIKPLVPDLHATVMDVYRQRRAWEKDKEPTVSPSWTRHDLARESAMLLEEELKQAGFVHGYDDVMELILLREGAARRKELDTLTSSHPLAASADQRLTDSYELMRIGGELISRTNVHTRMAADMEKGVLSIQALAETVRMLSLNAQIAAIRVPQREQQATLGTIAGLMQQETTNHNVFSLLSGIDHEIVDGLHKSLLPIIAIGLLSDMFLFFLREVTDSGQTDTTALAMAGTWIDASISQATTMLSGLAKQNKEAVWHAETIRSVVRSLQALDIQGRMESAILPPNSPGLALFQSLSEPLSSALTQIAVLLRAHRSLAESFAAELTMLDDCMSMSARLVQAAS